MTRRRLVLAYVILGAGALAAAGGLLGSETALRGGAGLAYLAALVHLVSFLIRGVPRRRPAILVGSGRTILAGCVGALLVVVGFNLIVVIGGWWTPRNARPADASAAVIAAVATLASAAALWRRPSARRAALLNVVALMVLALTMVAWLAPGAAAPGADHGARDVILAINLVVVIAVGISLDRLFASVDDAPAGPTVAPARLV